MEYRHTQIGVVIIVALVIPIVLVLAPILIVGTFNSIQIATLILLAAMLALFCSLNIEIKDNTLICRFGIGLIRKRIPLSEIQKARTVRNPLFAGWGIHYIPGHCWLWNVSGRHGVELILKDSKYFRLGTDEPEPLVHAIETNKAMGT